MSVMGGHVNPVMSLIPGRDTWKVRVRVLRMWDVCSSAKPSEPYAIQMVLIDAKGDKIEAIIKKTMISKFRREIVEGRVYKIVYFAVGQNSGMYRATSHEFKIFFNGRTRVVAEDSDTIPKVGLSLKNSDDIHLTMGESDYLIDMVGLVTAVSSVKEYAKGSNMSRMITIELTDDRGKIECALFGNYVDMVKEFVASNGAGLAVLIVQFAKVKTFKGKVVIQNVMNATKLLWNLDIPELSAFRDGLAVHGIDRDIPLGNIDDDIRSIPIEEEFLSLFPRKSIEELHSTAETGFFIVLAKITRLLDGEKWWYTACRCHRAVVVEDGMYFCPGCSTHVLEVTPRFRIKVEVSNDDETASFVLFDTDCQHILQKTCKELVLASKGTSYDSYPAAVEAIIGADLLFKVEKTSDHGISFDDSFKVKKICDHEPIIRAFKDKVTSSAFAPNSATHFEKGNFRHSLDSNVLSLDEISSDQGCSASSSVSVDGSYDGIFHNPPKKMKLRSVKLEKI